MRKWRLQKQHEDKYRKIGEVFTNNGFLTFFTCLDQLLIIEFEDKTKNIADEQIQKDGDTYFVNGEMLFPNRGIHKIEIPVEILKKRDERRNEYETYKKFKHIIQTNTEDGIIDFFLNTEGSLLIQHNRKSATVTQIETIYGKHAVNVEALELNHSYLELPEIVYTEFVDMQKKIGLVNLHLIPTGKSLLDGKEYYKLSVGLPNAEWKKVSSFFTDFGNDSELQGMLTCKPERVASALGIEFEKISA